jgi:subtilase family serine protease
MGSVKRALAAIALAALTACSATHEAVPGVSTASWQTPILPDHGASALPGATLPCGFPGHASKSHHVASCPMAINVHVPAIRNPHFPVSQIPGLHPDDIVRAYALPANAPGSLVAVVDAYGDRRAEKDMNDYRSKFGLPPCTSASGCFRQVNQKGQSGHYPHTSKAWAQEQALDIEMVSAVCPHCSILLVEANSASIDDLGAAVDTAVSLGAKIVSNSYYANEWADELSEDVHFNHPGVAITASSGDKAGSYYPAASPYVTAVAATTLKPNGNAFDESPWQFGGRGCSQFEPRPAFQPTTLCPTRSSVDMAAVGNPQTGVTAFSTPSGGWVVVGGTSVGAPIVAAAYALSGKPAGPAFSYSHPGDFRDIGAPGFDLATGLGSPQGVGGL